ncbi:MAG: type-4 uracil-DNA glycosylase [Candidatus Bathycorpusculaceae bacterium]
MQTTDKQAQLNAIASEIQNCKKCQLHKTRKNPVPGEGNPKTKIMLIGEAPGYWEDIKGKPFVGAAGKFLETLLAQLGFSRKNVFIANILKCRPPKNREPTQKEIQTCTPYLDRQIRAIQPKFIITLGYYSTAYILSKANIPFTSITQTHGKIYETSILDIPTAVFPTFHPAAALYSAKYKEQLTNDFQKIKDEFTKRGLIKSA